MKEGDEEEAYEEPRFSEYWGLGRQSLGQHCMALAVLTPPAPHTTQLADTLHTQSTKGDPRCQQADFINELLHIEIGMNVTKGAWGREIALSPLYSALLYCLMPSNSVCEDRNLSRCRTSEAQFPCLWVRVLKYVWAHGPR